MTVNLVLISAGVSECPLGWQVFGVYSLIPASTQIPMAILCKETTKNFVGRSDNFSVAATWVGQVGRSPYLTSKKMLKFSRF